MPFKRQMQESQVSGHTGLFEGLTSKNTNKRCGNLSKNGEGGEREIPLTTCRHTHTIVWGKKEGGEKRNSDRFQMAYLLKLMLELQVNFNELSAYVKYYIMGLLNVNTSSS